MRQRFLSDTYEHTKKRRLRRIAGRSSAELTRAFETGQLSLRRYDMLSRLSTRQQRRWIDAERRKTEAALMAAEAINEFLSRTGPGQVRLSEISAIISNAVRTARAVLHFKN
jgi:hypothetical protein